MTHMNLKKELPDYEIPQMGTIELVLEQAILSASDPTITNPDMDWDD